MANSSRYDEIGYWSEIKLDIIRKYDCAYSKILAKQRSISRHVYIDAFAGLGKHISKSTGQFVAGSPTNALLVEPPFSEYHFIDLDAQRVQSLQEIAQGRPNVTVHQGDCNEILHDHAFPRCRYEDFARGLCLLDPYSLNVDWKVLQTAGQMGSIEVFYNFMIMDANMNVLWKRREDVHSIQVERMNRVWGDESWGQAAYKNKQRALFDTEFISEKTSNLAVAGAFQERLRTVGGFKFVPDPLPMKNTQGAVVYYLYFASPNEKGAKIVKDIFDKYRGRM